MKPLSIWNIDHFDIIAINSKPYLFTTMRVDRKTLRNDVYAYDIRHGDESWFETIEPYVFINHFGTIIGKDELPLDEKWNWYIPDPDDFGFIDVYNVKSIGEYLKRYDELCEKC